MTIEVASGKNNVKFFFWIYISPGSLPSHGIFPLNMNNKPNSVINTPNKTSIFPIEFISSIIIELQVKRLKSQVKIFTFVFVTLLPFSVFRFYSFLFRE